MTIPLNPLGQRLKRRWKYLVIAGLAFIVLTAVFAPQRGNQILYGSTYGRAPSGYGAWYEYMAEQETPIQRWQKPLSAFLEAQSERDRPVTMLQVGSSSIWQEDYSNNRQELKSWIAKGNRLIILQSRGEVTLAPSRSLLDTPLGDVTIETRRRWNEDSESEETPQEALEAKREAIFEQEIVLLNHQLAARLLQTPPEMEAGSLTLLSDQQGGIVWAEAEGEGSAIYSVTPDLGANAYQNSPGNFAFLAGLVKAEEAELWVNEYSHGYKDKTEASDTAAVTWADYFLGTPLMLVWIQLLVLLAIALVALNRRWGLPRPLAASQLNNSEAYMGALAGVLRRSGSDSFVLSQWQAAERKRLQRQLGLGHRPVELPALLQSWEQQTGESAAPLQDLLSPLAPGSGSLRHLKSWLANWEQVRTLTSKHLS